MMTFLLRPSPLLPSLLLSSVHLLSSPLSSSPPFISSPPLSPPLLYLLGFVRALYLSGARSSSSLHQAPHTSVSDLARHTEPRDTKPIGQVSSPVNNNNTIIASLVDTGLKLDLISCLVCNQAENVDE